MTTDKNAPSEEEEIVFDFSTIKNWFRKKRAVKRESHTEAKNAEPQESKHGESEEVRVDFGRFWQIVKKYSPVLLILIPLIFSIYLRVQPAYLPITDQWAASAVYENLRNQISMQINQQYPNLPEQTRSTLVEQELQKIRAERGQELEQQIQQTSMYFKSQFQDENGLTYLLSIDPYYYQRHIENYLQYGQAGTTYLDPKNIPEAVELMYPNEGYNSAKEKISWDGERMAPIGSKTEMGFHTYFSVYLYKFIHFFNADATLLGTFFYAPVIISALAVIPAFFIGRKLSNNFGGFVAAFIVAIHPGFLGRTIGGAPDTDPYPVFFPLLITWLSLQTFDTENVKLKAILGALTGFIVGIFAFAWGGWWYIFDFILATVGLYLLYLLTRHVALLKNPRSFFLHPPVKNALLFLALFIFFSGLFITLIFSFNAFLSAVTGPLGFTQIKEVAKATLWPNIQTTVAELNEVSFRDIVQNVGGNLLFALAVFGIVFSFFKKDAQGRRDVYVKNALLLTLWFIGTIYASTKGVRFIMLLVPAFAIAFGCGLGILYQTISSWVSRELKVNLFFARLIMIFLLLLLLIKPLNAARGLAISEIPNIHDAWYDSLIEIKEKTPPDAIVNSWWDFGHWFITLTDRRVTFDGAGQDRHMAYWVGKSLLADDERETVGILRMVDCGNNNAFWKLDGYLNDTVKSIDILNEIIVLNRAEAAKVLGNYLEPDQVEGVLKYSHCQPPENYYITSEDMVGKSGVWAHFGSWNFTRAKMYNLVNGRNRSSGLQILREEFNLSEEMATQVYQEIQTADPNYWIAPWPSYLSGLANCGKRDNVTVACGNGLEVNLTDYSAYVNLQNGKQRPYSLTYINEEGAFEEKVFAESTVPGSALLIPRGSGYISILSAPQLAKSTFTRLFFFEGKDMDCFEPFSHRTSFTGEDIYVWKVRWECLDNTNSDNTNDNADNVNGNNNIEKPEG